MRNRFNPVSITILSGSGWFRARCSYSDDAAEMTVVVEERASPGCNLWREVYSGTFDGIPYHAMRDKVHDLVNRLAPSGAEGLA